MNQQFCGRCSGSRNDDSARFAQADEFEFGKQQRPPATTAKMASPSGIGRAPPTRTASMQSAAHTRFIAMGTHTATRGMAGRVASDANGAG